MCHAREKGEVCVPAGTLFSCSRQCELFMLSHNQHNPITFYFCLRGPIPLSTRTQSPALLLSCYRNAVCSGGRRRHRISQLTLIVRSLHGALISSKSARGGLLTYVPSVRSPLTT